MKEIFRIIEKDKLGELSYDVFRQEENGKWVYIGDPNISQDLHSIEIAQDNISKSLKVGSHDIYDLSEIEFVAGNSNFINKFHEYMDTKDIDLLKRSLLSSNPIDNANDMSILNKTDELLKYGSSADLQRLKARSEKIDRIKELKEKNKADFWKRKQQEMENAIDSEPD